MASKLTAKQIDELFDVEEAFDTSSLTSQSIMQFDLLSSAEHLKEHLKFPRKKQTIRLVSPAKGWSSCSLIMAIAEKEPILELYATTLRVGKKEMMALQSLDIPVVHLTLGGIAKENGRYKYEEELQDFAKENGWHIRYCRNHSKIILLKTKKHFYVVETSSNLNENPQIEQFALTNSQEVFEFYKAQMQKLGVWNCGT